MVRLQLPSHLIPTEKLFLCYFLGRMLCVAASIGWCRRQNNILSWSVAITLSVSLIRSRCQAMPATLLIPINFSFPSRGGGALRYSVPKWLLFFFWGGVTATAPSRDLTDNKKKEEGGLKQRRKQRKLLKETQNQRKETRKKKKNQVEYRVEGAQDRRRRRKPGGWKETPNTRKRGGDALFLN